MPPNAGICQLLTCYFTRVPDFCESLRVLNLSGQCVLVKDVARLFSKQNPLRFPSLKSMTLRIICDKERINCCIDPPPQLEHLEVYAVQCLCRQVSETLLPLLRKIKHLVWYRGDAYGPTFTDVFKEPLQSLETIETEFFAFGHFGPNTMKLMPSLKSLITRSDGFVQTVDVKQFLEDGGDISKVFDVSGPSVRPYEKGRHEAVTIYLHFDMDGYEHLRGNRKIRELSLCLSTINTNLRLYKLFVDRVLPLISTLVNLEVVIIYKYFLLSWSMDRRPNDNLSKRFQFPSVRRLQFTSFLSHIHELDNDEKDPTDPLIYTFAQMFPNLDTLILLHIVKFPDERPCPKTEAASLPRLRKVAILFKDICETSRACFNWPRSWENVEILLINIRQCWEYSAGLLAQLKERRNLRHLCIMGEMFVEHGFYYSSGASPQFSVKEIFENFVDAWRDRNWQTIIFIITDGIFGEITVFGAERNADGSVEYKEIHKKPSNAILSLFPQLYALFWQEVFLYYV